MGIERMVRGVMKATWTAILMLLAAGAVSAAQVEVFSPQGEVKGVRQVAVRFSEPWLPSAIRACRNLLISNVPSPELRAGQTRRTGCTTSAAICRPECVAVSV